MPLSWPDFLAQRGSKPYHYFACPGATRTVMVCSHIWWTDQIALSFLNAGCNVLVHFPFYLLYTDEGAEGAQERFEELWGQILRVIREAKVDLIVGGNSAAMLVHPKSGEMIQDAAATGTGRKVTLLNWWWDEPRTKPPLARHGGVTPADYLRLLGNANTVNAIWDIDVQEELEAAYGLKNLIHMPLGTLPEYWPHGYIPMESRPLTACFLGNCHFNADWAETDPNPLTGWGREIVRMKIAQPQRAMQRCIGDVTVQLGGVPADPKVAGDAWLEFSWPMEVLNAVYMHYTRNRYVVVAEKHLKGKLALVGKGWGKIGLRANMEHAGDKSGVIYGQSQISLNLFGGCVHGGLPLRPYDIGASGGLIVTHNQRELPALFEPGKECLVFSSEEEMVALVERIRASPREYNGVAQAGRRRTLTHHTWTHRIGQLLDALSMA